MEIMLKKNKCCLYVIISIRFFSITICNLIIEFPSYKVNYYKVVTNCPYFPAAYHILHFVYYNSITIN